MRLNVLIREQYGDRVDRARLTELSKLYISRQFEIAADEFAVRAMQGVFGEDSQQMLLQAAEELDWIGSQGIGSNHILALPFDRTHPDLNRNRILDYLGL
jgi:Zn-dependent protease with chaperone function